MSVSSSVASEFLTRQIQIQKRIVTFRCLSRALSIHVNVAKKYGSDASYRHKVLPIDTSELASFHASSQSTDEPVHATFLLTGDVSPVDAARSYRNGDEMDVDDGQAECVLTTKIILVGEEELEAAKAQFTRQPSVHVYSLSPSAIRVCTRPFNCMVVFNLQKDATLLAQMADSVRSEDVSKGKAYNQLIGIVVGADVKVGRVRKSVPAKTAKASASSSAKANPPAEDKTIADKLNKSETGKVPHKVKLDEKKKGTLNWSKAKTKANNDNNATTMKEKTVIKKASQTNLLEREESKVKGKEERERSRVAPEKPRTGTKRPPTVMTLSESEEEAQDDNPAPKTKLRTSSPLPSRLASGTQKALKVKKSILFSSDDDDNSVKEQPKPARQMRQGKGRAVLSEEEEEADHSVRGMMDLDDSHVTRHNQALASPPVERSNEDAGMLNDSEPIRARPKPKRKAKKSIPIGTNGLPKKRVMKSRKSKNARGYMVTEDYSSYESASDSEQVELPDTETNFKAKQRAKKDDDLTSTSIPTAEKPARSKPHGKPRGSTTSIVKGNSSSVELSKKANADGEEKSETKKTGSGGYSKSSAAVATANNRDKNHIMNYFGKK